MQASADNYYMELQYDGLQLREPLGWRDRAYPNASAGSTLSQRHAYVREWEALRERHATQRYLYTHMAFYVLYYAGHVTTVYVDMADRAQLSGMVTASSQSPLAQAAEAADKVTFNKYLPHVYEIDGVDVLDASETMEVTFTYSVKWLSDRNDSIGFDAMHHNDTWDPFPSGAPVRRQKVPNWVSAWEWDREIRRVSLPPPRLD